MSKIDNQIVNDINAIAFNMLKQSNSSNFNLIYNSVNTFYTLFLKHFNYDPKNINWINKDRIIFNEKLLPVYYACKHLFGFDISIDDLKEYKKLNDKIEAFNYNSYFSGDIIGYATGDAYAQKYISNLIQKEIPKSKLIDFKTYCICTYEDIISGTAFESLNFIIKEELKNLVLIVLNSEEENKSLYDMYEDIGFNILTIDYDDVKGIDTGFKEAKKSKDPTIIFINSKYDKELKNIFNKEVFTDKEIDCFKDKWKKSDLLFVDNTHYEYIKKNIDKRLKTVINDWKKIKSESNRVKNIIDFLDSKEIKTNFNIDNLKISDDYNEELLKGNEKIYNIFANKNPFIISLEYGKNFKNKKEENKIYFNGQELAISSIACGIAKFGFKVFVKMPLISSNNIKSFVKYSAFSNLNITFIFTNDSFLSTYDNLGISAVDEMNSFRLIPKLITFRPADINEIIGVYNILANYNGTSIIFIGNEVTRKLKESNPKYVVAGAYRIKREVGEANGVLIATGSEVSLALKLSEELLSCGIDLRVVSMPSVELFNNQTERYRYALLPKELKTFVIEFGSTALWKAFATSSEYIFGIDRYSTSGTQEELLNKYDLNKDAIKSKIIEIMKK